MDEVILWLFFYSKLWKLLIDKQMTIAELIKPVDIASDSLTRANIDLPIESVNTSINTTLIRRRKLCMKGYGSPFLAIQYHLYEHPLYTCCSHAEQELNALIVGFGEYGQQFPDACLQNGQIWDKKPNVYYESARVGFRKEYNHNSCVSGALSLRYKLYRIVIDLETAGLAETAKKFGSILS